jgi:PAS domain S-box-containing protein
MSTLGSALSIDDARRLEETKKKRAASLELTLEIGLAVVLAIVGAIGIASYFNVIRLIEHAQWVAHTDEVIANLEGLLSRITDVETASRGYAITGSDSYLEPYKNGSKEGSAILSELKQLTSDNALQQRRVEMLRPIFAERLAAALAVIEARKIQDFEGAKRMVLSGKEKEIHDRIRGIVSEMLATERKLLITRQDRTKRATTFTELVIIAGCTIATTCIGFALFFIKWQFGQRATLLATLRHQLSALARSHEQLRERAQVLDLAQVLVRDMDNRIVEWTLGMERLYGFSKEQALGQISHELFQTQFPDPVAQIENTLRRNGEWDGELKHRKPDGARLIVACRWVLHRDSAGCPVRIL